MLKFRLFDRDSQDIIRRSCVEVLEFDNDIDIFDLIEY
jgi:hypothetical protein